MIVPVDNLARVGEARRNAMNIARDEGLDENLTSDVGIVATELSTNLVKHASQGEIHISVLSDREEQGVELLAIDRGPGFIDLGQKIADGYSTAGSAGTGLGAIIRLSTDFDAFSQLGRGTVVVARVCAQSDANATRTTIAIGTVSRPITGEIVSGDAWATVFNGDGCLILLADGLGHGPQAALASGKAVSAFEEARDRSLIPVLHDVHAALRGTRGAAVSIACISYAEESVAFAGIGNVAGRVVGWNWIRQMVSHVGTAGFEARRFQEFNYPLPATAAVIMHSDGLTTSWNLDDYPGLLERDPSLIAAVLYRDASRGRDDVCVVVAKKRETV